MELLYNTPNFVEFYQQKVFIPNQINPVFYGIDDSNFKANVIQIIDIFTKEELLLLAGKIVENHTMICKLFLDTKFIPSKVPKNKVLNEAFELVFTVSDIKITAASKAGLHQGLNTLLEIFRNHISNGQINSFMLQDSPQMAIRGVHLFLPSRADIPFYKRFVSRFLAPLHYNTVFLEVGGAMQFDRHPEINEGTKAFARWVFDHHSRPFGVGGRFQDSAHAELAGGDTLSKDEIKELVEFTRLYGIEVIPEIPSLTHSYYLTAAHREIAEIPEALWPDAYCPSNPLSRKILFDVMDEYIEVMKPKTIHIGHDEWRAPALCNKCLNKAPELFAQDVCSIYDFLTKQQISTAMWADGLLPICDGATTYTCIDSIPKDILLLHWGWQFDHHQERLSSRNFKMILGNFNLQMQQDEWEKTIQDSNVLGAEVSSWIGMNYNRFAIEGTLWQMLGSSNYLWQGARPSHDKMNNLVTNYLSSIGSRLQEKPKSSYIAASKSVTIDISSYLNMGSLVNNKAMDWSIESLLPGNRKWRNIDVNVPNPWNNKYLKCVMTSAKNSKLEGDNSRSTFLETLSESAANIPESVTIAIDKKVAGLLFFHFSSNQAIRKNAPYQTVDEEDPFQWCCHIGEYEITYASTKKEIIPLRYGFNIDDFRSFYGNSSKFPLPDCVPAIRVDAFSGFPAGAIGAMEWQNPNPSDRILSVTIRAIENSSYVYPVLFGITALVEE